MNDTLVGIGFLTGETGLIVGGAILYSGVIRFARTYINAVVAAGEVPEQAAEQDAGNYNQLG